MVWVSVKLERGFSFTVSSDNNIAAALASHWSMFQGGMMELITETRSWSSQHHAAAGRRWGRWGLEEMVLQRPLSSMRTFRIIVHESWIYKQVLITSVLSSIDSFLHFTFWVIQDDIHKQLLIYVSILRSSWGHPEVIPKSSWGHSDDINNFAKHSSLNTYLEMLWKLWVVSGWVETNFSV